jgi:uncharacterized RDD family membrane protein YckC
MSSPQISPLPGPSNQPFSFGGYAGAPGGLEGVGFGARLAARVIDLALHYIVTICAGLVFGFLVGVVGTLTGRSVPFLASKLNHLGFITFALALLGSVAYHSVCESLHGSTLGKFILSMVVVQEDGTPCTFDSALRRSFAYFVDGLFFGLVGYFAMQKTPQRQRYGDQWAHTVVCKRSQVRPENLRDGGRFVLSLFLGMAADAGLMMLGLVLAITVF